MLWLRIPLLFIVTTSSVATFVFSVYAFVFFVKELAARLETFEHK